MTALSTAADPAVVLMRAIVASAAAAGCVVEIAAAEERPWASATFVGARHRLTVDAAPSRAFDAWLAGLSDTELVMRGLIAAELTVERRDRCGDRDRAAVTVLALHDD